jgi:hypothetical protein
MALSLPGAACGLLRNVLALCLAVALAGCSRAPAPAAAPSPAAPTPAWTATAAQPSATPTRTETPAPTRTPPPSATPAPSLTPTFTPIPTYLILRAEVLVRANCRYGPGAPYLYKYGLVPGSNLEVIGRTDSGTWLLVQAIGGNNPCWVKATLMDVRGDVMQVAPTYIPLPQSPYYGPLTGVYAIRSGSAVTVFWNPVGLRAGDETAEAPYLVEAWVCRAGELVFTPLGSYTPFLTIDDQPGCSLPSHGRVFLVEKHGYSRWVEIPWPLFEE